MDDVDQLKEDGSARLRECCAAVTHHATSAWPLRGGRRWSPWSSVSVAYGSRRPAARWRVPCQGRPIYRRWSRPAGLL